MNPHLVAVAGPFQGTVFPITGQDLSIGRERSNSVCLEDRAVSRRHAVISREGDQFQLRDLGSQNRTAVNGVPVEFRVLKHGDQIRIGHSVFVVGLEGEAPMTNVTASLLVDDGPVGDHTVVLQQRDARYLDPASVVEACSRPGGAADSLKCLLQVGDVVASTRGLQHLAGRLLQVAASVIPAERGAILLIDADGGEVSRQYGWQRDAGAGQAPRVPRSIVSRVLAEHVSIWSNDVCGDGTVGRSESLIASRARSVLAVPIMLSGRVLGVMYLDTTDPAVQFNEDHLHLLTGIARMAAGGLEGAAAFERVSRDHARLQAELDLQHDMVGDGPRIQQVYGFIAKVAPSESTVLIEGESGTGKELVARAIHRNSPRAPRPFIAINCATLGEALLESELFGHERGAFTGAIVQKKGKLEEGQGGTIFLDEIGELATVIQAKLLRVLQQREFERVGGTRLIKADIRLVAATNRDLKEEVKRGAFRQDLFFRLNVVSIMLPPLRERREDIPKLVSHFIGEHTRKSPRRVTTCSPEALACLRAYEWPGNVRELENAIERALVLGSSSVILPEDLPEDILEAEAAGDAPTTKFHDTIKQMKKQLVLKALEQAAGNYTEAARLLGLHPNNLHRLMTNLRLRSTKA